jgi:large subunit ribosomal protein L6
MAKTTKTEEIELPEGVQATMEDKKLRLKGEKGENQRVFNNPNIKIGVKDNKIIINCLTKPTKRQKKIIGTFRAHIKNLIKGAKEGHTYKLRACSSHFPMNVSINNNELVVKNFLGEKHPRKLAINEGCDVKINGEEITVTSCNKEIAGQTAAKIELLTRITNKDRRIFQDGIFITEKDGRQIS